MRNNVFETILGAVVLIIAGVFLFFGYQSADIGEVSGYKIIGDFTNIDGLKEGSDVRVSGVKVGTITSIYLNEDTYRATAEMSIDNDIQLPLDTVGIVTSEGLLGGKYLALEVGGDEEFMKDGDELYSTQPSISLEKMIGQVLFSLSNDNEEDTTSPAESE